LQQLDAEHQVGDVVRRLPLVQAAGHVQALADDARTRDGDAAAELARVKARLREVEQTSSRRWTAMERDVDALYTSQFANRKGANP
jgi:hypothetical protein